MRRFRRVVLATTVVGAVAGGFMPSARAVGLEGEYRLASKPPKVKVQLVEYQVQPALEFVAKGKLKFAFKNAGTEKHEIVVVRGDDPAALPTKPDGSVDEDQIAKRDKVGEVENIKKGKTKSKSFKLKTGSYILFCNIVDTEKDGTVVSHFAQGMYTTINAS